MGADMKCFIIHSCNADTGVSWIPISGVPGTTGSVAHVSGGGFLKS